MSRKAKQEESIWLKPLASLSLAIKHAQLDRHNAEQMARIARDTADPSSLQSVRGATAAGDERKLRGIPVLSFGVGGAINGSIPHIHGVPFERD